MHLRFSKAIPSHTPPPPGPIRTHDHYVCRASQGTAPLTLMITKFVVQVTVQLGS